jgi:hypothetical protein
VTLGDIDRDIDRYLETHIVSDIERQTEVKTDFYEMRSLCEGRDYIHKTT